jgi:hypothetical protein
MSKDKPEREGQQQDSDSRKASWPGAEFRTGSLRVRPEYTRQTRSFALKIYAVQLQMAAIHSFSQKTKGESNSLPSPHALFSRTAI